MSEPIERFTVKTARHTTAYWACGPLTGPPIVFLHGWPELGLMWRPALTFFGALGYRALAPDLRGYGDSSVPSQREDYALEEIVRDMVELLDGVGSSAAIWIGHDWGSPVVWAIAGHHPERTRGVANLCVPYFAQSFGAETLIAYVNRDIYPLEQFPAGQWDYIVFYHESFATASAAFEVDISATFRALMRSGDPRHLKRPARLAYVRRDGGWFGGAGRAPDVPRDPAVLSEDELAAYVAAFTKTGFAGADSWYVNDDANTRYAQRLPNSGKLACPVLFVHAANDVICETVESHLADPMRADCTDLTERTLPTGHWLVQERPAELNAILAGWFGSRPELGV